MKHRRLHHRKLNRPTAHRCVNATILPAGSLASRGTQPAPRHRGKRRDAPRLSQDSGSPVPPRLFCDRRLSMLRTMALQVIEHGRIKTTLAKAHEVHKWVDRCVTLGKEGTYQAKVKATAKLWVARKDLIRKLFT